MTSTPIHCDRCKRLAPDQVSDEFGYWEALGPTGEKVICPGCITGGEEAAIGDDAMATAEAVEQLAAQERGAPAD